MRSCCTRQAAPDSRGWPAKIALSSRTVPSGSMLPKCSPLGAGLGWMDLFAGGSSPGELPRGFGEGPARRGRF